MMEDEIVPGFEYDTYVKHSRLGHLEGWYLPEEFEGEEGPQGVTLNALVGNDEALMSLGAEPSGYGFILTADTAKQLSLALERVSEILSGGEAP